ncbi:class D sortase [Planococcus sp. YIM B11945]|uniref:class D sortase n=1 Tax=Planococcus sp. YIM B11945 TaxID=3435410 RepID=UPI003D7E17F5
MNKPSFPTRILKVAHKLSPGFLILGICLIGWASYQIYSQSFPAPVVIEQPQEQFEQVVASSEAVDIEKAKEEPADQDEIIDLLRTSEAVAITEERESSDKDEITVPIRPTESAALAEETENQNANEILYPIRPVVGENIGNLTIPALNQKLPIVHGTDEDELSSGIGHFAGSVLPGEKDNSVLAGHRDTVFRELGQLKITDQLIVETSAGTFTYEIREIKIVPKEDKSIITPTASAVLTVTTCYPFSFVGSAPDRYILIADLVSSE